MTDCVIVRGTTPSLIVDFSGVTAFTVSDITAVALTVKQRTKTDTYTLDDMEIGESILGINNVWSDAGDIDVEYRADTKLYIGKRLGV